MYITPESGAMLQSVASGRTALTYTCIMYCGLNVNHTLYQCRFIIVCTRHLNATRSREMSVTASPHRAANLKLGAHRTIRSLPVNVDVLISALAKLWSQNCCEPLSAEISLNLTISFRKFPQIQFIYQRRSSKARAAQYIYM